MTLPHLPGATAPVDREGGSLGCFAARAGVQRAATAAVLSCVRARHGDAVGRGRSSLGKKDLGDPGNDQLVGTPGVLDPCPP